MRGILADINVEGILTVLVRIWLSDTWREFWNDLGLSIQDFDSLGIPFDSSDKVVWRTCQDQRLVLGRIPKIGSCDSRPRVFLC